MDYIPIRDFAAEAGVSKQAVYARLTAPEIAQYVKTDEDGHKVIHRDALSLFKVTAETVNQSSQDKLTSIIDSVNRENISLKAQNAKLSLIIDDNNATIKALTDQLNAANEQIKSISALLDTRAGEITTLHRLLDQQQQLALAQLKALPQTNKTAEVVEPPNSSKSRFAGLRSFFRR